jgi:hypothetical protein
MVNKPLLILYALFPMICFTTRISSSHALVEKGSLVQHPNGICPGSARKSGPMTGLGPGSCLLKIGPGSFWSIRPDSWHQPGPMPPARGTWRSAEHWFRFMPRTGIKDPPLAINKPSPLPFATKFCWIVCEVWVLAFFSFDCTQGVRRNVRATLKFAQHGILGRG